MKKWGAVLLVAVLLLAAFMILPVHGEGEVYDRVIRLHVLANSNSAEDQALKLVVRDAVLAESRVLLSGVESREQAAEVLQGSLPRIEQAACEALAAAGAENSVTATLDVEEYPTRQYESLAFPAGEYLSLRVMIGKAEGNNWWCVLFPPLCLSAASDAATTEAAFLSAGLSGEQYRMIADTDETKYKVRFKLLELAQSLFH